MNQDQDQIGVLRSKISKQAIENFFSFNLRICRTWIEWVASLLLLVYHSVSGVASSKRITK